MDAIIIALNALVIITHILRLTYLMFKPHLLTRIRFITIPPPFKITAYTVLFIDYFGMHNCNK